MSTRSLLIDSSPHVVPDKNGLGVTAGESFELVITLGPHVLRSARFYGDEQYQHRVLEEATEALYKSRLETKK